MDALPSFLDASRFTNIDQAWTAAPISVIRVRLAGELGLDDTSRERVRLVAEQIATSTGLEVDIMVGSSPTPMPIALDAGTHGRPALALTQSWAKKGVAVSIVNAVDRKSLLLFVLILAVCTLFVTNATAAAVQSRRLELAVLSCLGWRPAALYRHIIVESALYGLVASLLGVAATLPVGSLLGLRPDPRWLLVTVPVTTALAVVAALGPARRAARSDPAAAIRPSALVPRRSRPPRSVAALALANVTRLPGRTLLGAASLAIGVCALTLLAAIAVAFQGAVVGTLLGDAVSVQAPSRGLPRRGAHRPARHRRRRRRRLPQHPRARRRVRYAARLRLA
ncbi:ABC transporter permease [Rhizomonospora bruguierae]|uniref:ABC transporter permease n=1 Tax=Rhizomonospora bruguierae TaxID=1581705 RepID=UPI001BCD17E1|nr:ABC transporter permease [Micromonospora sp. NBRC 107566]